MSGGEPLAERILELERELEGARAVDARWLDLVHGAVHNLRTPLATASGYLELLLLDPERLDERQRDFVQRAVGGTRALGRQIELLDDIARLAAGRWSPALEERELLSLAGLALARLEADERSRLQWRERAPGKIVGDSEMLARALGGLVCRALARAPEESAIELAVTAADGDRLRFSTFDRGPALGVAQVADLFGTPAAHGGHRSPRLDLHFALQASQRHGGRVGGESAADGWTALWLELPRATEPAGG